MNSRSGTKAPDCTLQLRIDVLAPLAGVNYALQGRTAAVLLDPVTAQPHSLQFELEIRLRTAETGPDFAGEHVQGGRGDRFLYVCSGQRARQPFSVWSRRAKLKLAAIDPSLLAQAAADGGMLQASFHGVAGDGGPFCGTVKPLGAGWTLSR